VITAVLA